MDLYYWRRLNGFTQKQVAVIVGIDPTMVSKYERKLAKPTLRHLAIIHILTSRQVTVEDFLYGDERSNLTTGNNQSPKNTLQSNTSSTCI